MNTALIGIVGHFIVIIINNNLPILCITRLQAARVLHDIQKDNISWDNDISDDFKISILSRFHGGL